MTVRILGLLLFVMTIWTPPSLAEEALSIASRKNTLTNRFAEDVLTEAYGRIGRKVTFTLLPGARSIIEANEGHVDGEAARLTHVLKEYENLRLVPVPLFHSELSVFVRDDYMVSISNWESLAPYSITSIRGFKFVEDKTKTMTRRLVTTSDKSIDLVEKELIDIAVLNKFLGNLAISRSGAKHIKIIEPPLERIPVYHLVHKKHQELIPELTSALKKMEAEGTIKSMWENFVSREIKKARK